ncbi:MAG: hypothetical protein LQ352_004559 [Teloschistes flavicans]|nr:MAG: hypothetical protein LQ352_004559 [Teloschistes flavicans]
MEKIHGENGIVPALAEATYAFRELRMDIEYGDYLDYICERYRHKNMKDLEKEDLALANYVEYGRYHGRSHPHTDTAWFGELATMIVTDKENLQSVYGNNGPKQTDYLKAITAIQKEWFVDCYRRRPSLSILFILNEKGPLAEKTRGGTGQR